jgi:hypothetical protein
MDEDLRYSTHHIFSHKKHYSLITSTTTFHSTSIYFLMLILSYGPPWAHYLGGYQDRLLGGPLGLPGLRYTAPDGVEHKDYGGVVLG